MDENFTRVHEDFAIRIRFRSSRSDSKRVVSIFYLYLFLRLEKS